ncbi:hypothetical protein Ngar_c14350 [Candidatus Nitrososphaera gargensis Ga9.2]|uniref:Exo-alpha-sialidase n=1 Tax=Nitrososphaera gargensis (strain Ga9.2) TaxID=1237085 RepID=K0IAM0_NITGG|nr:hypothetical protein Ngar_c14350 [Candidatus Nitrososphaera gargensis Ga9.2]
MAVSGENIYITWQSCLVIDDSAPCAESILFTKSDDNGTTFDKPIILFEGVEAAQARMTIAHDHLSGQDNVAIIW